MLPTETVETEDIYLKCLYGFLDGLRQEEIHPRQGFLLSGHITDNRAKGLNNQTMLSCMHAGLKGFKGIVLLK